MRIRLAVVSGGAVVLLAGAGAAYAVVDRTPVDPTETGNVLPIDSNHRSTARPEPGDDEGGLPGSSAVQSRADDGPGHR